MEPLAVAVNAVATVAELRPTSTVAVFGAGPVGLLYATSVFDRRVELKIQGDGRCKSLRSKADHRNRRTAWTTRIRGATPQSRDPHRFSCRERGREGSIHTATCEPPASCGKSS